MLEYANHLIVFTWCLSRFWMKCNYMNMTWLTHLIRLTSVEFSAADLWKTVSKMSEMLRCAFFLCRLAGTETLGKATRYSPCIFVSPGIQTSKWSVQTCRDVSFQAITWGLPSWSPNSCPFLYIFNPFWRLLAWIYTLFQAFFLLFSSFYISGTRIFSNGFLVVMNKWKWTYWLRLTLVQKFFEWLMKKVTT